MVDEKLVYGGYVNYPLAPKDLKNVQAMVDQYTTNDDYVNLVVWFETVNYGFKLECKPFTKEWRCVSYNLLPVKAGDNHTYYISGESDTPFKALIVTKYKIEAMAKSGLQEWVKSEVKGEFR